MDVYLRAKFEVSSIILTSFRGRGGGEFYHPPPPPTSKQTPKKPSQIRVKAHFRTNVFLELTKFLSIVLFGNREKLY